MKRLRSLSSKNYESRMVVMVWQMAMRLIGTADSISASYMSIMVSRNQPES